jgi:hypothetical protein
MPRTDTLRRHVPPGEDDGGEDDEDDDYPIAPAAARVAVTPPLPPSPTASSRRPGNHSRAGLHGDARLVAGALEIAREHLGDRRVVVDHEQRAAPVAVRLHPAILRGRGPNGKARSVAFNDL